MVPQKKCENKNKLIFISIQLSKNGRGEKGNLVGLLYVLAGVFYIVHVHSLFLSKFKFINKNSKIKEVIS